MNILIVILSLEIGGAENQAVTDANLLTENGHKVTILFAREGKLIKKLNCTVKIINIETSNQFFASFKLLCFLIKNRYDVIHSHMFWAEKVSAIPAFLTRHPLLFNEHGLGVWRRWYHKIIMRFSSCFANNVACSCKLNCEIKNANHEVIKKKLITLYPSINDKSIQIINSDNWQKRIIGFVGRFNEVKRLGHFIDIADKLLDSKLKNFKILLVGGGEEYSNILNRIKEKKLIDYFELN